jgi:hypothetical protein
MHSIFIAFSLQPFIFKSPVCCVNSIRLFGLAIQMR